MARSILVKPVITEKMTLLQEQKNQYAFEVDINSTKVDIKNAVQKKFNVKVESIRTVTSKEADMKASGPAGKELLLPWLRIIK